MSGPLWHLPVAAALLAAVVALLWVRAAPRLAAGDRMAGAIVVIATAGGLAGAPFWLAALPGSMALALPPLALRLLGAAGIAFGLAGWVALARPEPQRLRLILAMLVVYLVPLLVAALVLHPARLDWSLPITWAFVALASGLGAAAVLGLATGARPAQAAAPARPMRLALLLAAGVLAVWAGALALWPQGPWPALWVWPADTLAGRVVAVMLLTLAWAAGAAARDARLAGTAGAALAGYGLGAILVAGLQAAAGRPVPWAYALGLGVLGLLGIVLARRG